MTLRNHCMWHKGFLRSIVWIVALCPAHVLAQVPLDPAAFTAVIAEALRGKLDAGTRISSSVPLAIELDTPGVRLPTLDGLHAKCGAYAGYCRDAIQKYVDSAAETIAGPPLQPAPSQMRVLIRHREFVEQLPRGEGGNGPAPPIARPFVGDLWMVLALAGKHVHWLVTPGVLHAFNLDSSAAFEIARRNTRAALPRLSHVVKPMGSSGFSHAHGESYSSRLLLWDDWRAVAAARKGELLAIVPDADNIIFGTIRSSTELDKFKRVAADATRITGDSRSATIYRWRNEGWEVMGEGRMAMELRVSEPALAGP
jgi:hypothetical protein